MKNGLTTVGFMQSFGVIAAFSFIGGYINTYTYVVRGGVFANNQTGNMSKLAVTIFERDAQGMTDALLPILATILGAFVAEYVRVRCRSLPEGTWHMRVLLWEIPAFIIVGFVPLAVPNAIVTVFLSFVGSFQLSGFRTYEGWVFNSTIQTGNLRSLGQYIYQALLTEKNRPFTKKTMGFIVLLLLFILGGYFGATFSGYWSIRAIWACVPILTVIVAVHSRICRQEEVSR